jgi:hypothetical protein
MPFGLMNCPVQVSLLVDRVCVSEQQPFAPRLPGRSPNCVRFAGPTLLQLVCLNHRNPSEATRYLCRPICRVVVHNDKFPIFAEFKNVI